MDKKELDKIEELVEEKVEKAVEQKVEEEDLGDSSSGLDRMIDQKVQ